MTVRGSIVYGDMFDGVLSIQEYGKMSVKTHFRRSIICAEYYL